MHSVVRRSRLKGVAIKRSRTISLAENFFDSLVGVSPDAANGHVVADEGVANLLAGH